jgi:hypothetical protein
MFGFSSREFGLGWDAGGCDMDSRILIRGRARNCGWPLIRDPQSVNIGYMNCPSLRIAEKAILLLDICEGFSEGAALLRLKLKHDLSMG